MWRAGLAVASVLAMAAPLGAQGTISTQGFGYPLGGLSTRSLATGGALGEFDHLSSRNPAATGGWGRSGLYFEFDPEMRTINTANASDRTTVARFGVIAAGFTVGQRWAIGASNHAFLDRSWATRVRSGQRLGDDSVSYLESFSSRGGIGENRLAVSYTVHPKLVIGAGLHLFSGENRVKLARQFDDSIRYGSLTRDLTLSYSGTGASAGAIVTPFKGLSLAGSYRYGGTMRLRVVDTLRTEANVPTRYGLAMRLDLIPGLSLLGSADHNQWSKLSGLGSTTANGIDAWEYAGGAQFTGQRTRNVPWTYSVGYRQRDLPFAAAGSVVSEKIISGGVSIPVSGPRATIEMAVQRAARDAAAGSTSERAWLLSFGLSVRP